MKKFLALTMILALMLSLTLIASAAAAGPFDTLEAALGGKTWIANPEFVDGAETAWGDGESESAPKLFDGDVETKFGQGDDYWPYWATWKYEQAYVADSFILATANDNEGSPRRMDDGWTLSGSDDGSNWNVLYTGKMDDYENLNFTYFRIDLPDNTTAYQYYKLNSDFGGDSTGIQLSEVGITGFVPAPVVEEVAEVVVVEAPVVEVAPVEAAPAPVAVPQTGFVSFAIVGILGAAVTFGKVSSRK